MPGRSKHLEVATILAVIVGLYAIRKDSAAGAVARISGFQVGARAGALMPDLLEPGIHSWHRRFCHSEVAPTAGAQVKRSPAAV
jgi:hypothetical protein